MKTTSRRVFVHQSTTLAASLAFANKLSALAVAAPGSAPVRAWITSGEDRFKPLALDSWRAASGE
jgi:hypothetical protein